MQNQRIISIMFLAQTCTRSVLLSSIFAFSAATSPPNRFYLINYKQSNEDTYQVKKKIWVAGNLTPNNLIAFLKSPNNITSSLRQYSLGRETEENEGSGKLSLSKQG